MSIYVYNTLTRKKEEFKPLNPPEVKIYTCGVTVYDECHIGHARSLYIFDVIRRYLEYKNFKVNFVRNITDIDDKIINRAKELKKDWKELVREYIASYKKDLQSLGIRLGDVDEDGEEPRATKNIPGMIEYIKDLVDKGYAYVTDSGVYFSVRKFRGYGKLSGQSIDQMLTGVRKEPDETKDDPLDFALWKLSKPDEPFWESPWGKGRPGWHIECSVMSQKFLRTDTLDMHAGGRDLIFPHHENEIAQSEAKTGKQFAKYWIHHGLLTINGQKMAKSLGNFITIKDFINQYYDTDILKLFFLSTHYSNPIDYNKEKMEEFKKQKKNFNDFFDSVNNWLKITPTPVSSKEDKTKIDDICTKFQKAMDDDFNTPVALASLFELIDLASVFISGDKEEAFNYAKSELETFLGIFGIATKPKEELPPRMVEMMKERREARAKKDFRTADAIRNDIQKIFDYLISDTNGSATAKRK
jgi:cysteinyl-tRNA synthetase